MKIIMDNGIWNLAPELEKDENKTQETVENIVTEEELSNKENLPEPLQDDSETTLKEELYKEQLQEEIAKTKEEKQEQLEDIEIPEPTPEEKSDAVDEIKEEIKEELNDKWVKDDTLEQIAEMFYEKELNYQKKIKELEIENKKVNEAYDSLLSEYNDQKYDKNRVKIDDEDIWYIVNLKQKYIKNPSDKWVQKDLAKYYMLELKTLYPEFDPVAVTKQISEKRVKALEAISSTSESKWWIEVTRETTKSKPVGFAIPNI